MANKSWSIDDVDPWEKTIGSFAYAQDRAKTGGSTVEDYMNKSEEMGWTISDQARADYDAYKQGNQTVTRYEDQLGYTPTENEITLLRSQELGSTDPLVDKAKTRALETVGNIDPGKYEDYAAQSQDRYGVFADREAELRAQRSDALGQLHRYATGQDSAVQKQADYEREMIAREAASNMASARGGYNPALAAAVMSQQSQAQTDLAARAAAMRAQEEATARDAYMRGLGTASQADMGSESTLASLLAQGASAQGMADQTRSGLYGMATGQQNVFVNPAAQMQMQANTQAFQQQMSDQDFYRNLLVNMGQGVIKGGSDYLTLGGSK